MHTRPAAIHAPSREALRVRHLGRVDYLPVWRQMQDFTARRSASTPDEAWFLEHHPVFTQGRNGRPEHLHDTGDIPVIQVDRGGQVTYHGPGQLVVYTLLDIDRRTLGVRPLVRLLEQAVIDLLSDHGLAAHRRDRAPGVYVDGHKIASLGLRIRRGCSFHGLSLNVNMDITPFSLINPCGMTGLGITQLADLGVVLSVAETARQFRHHLERLLDRHDEQH
ncbi:MAG: lipoyl(octanoyl) transferase LipB [Gammaproteobacteria bacterium]|jgi:lipoyl(octanoyl) transferase